MSLTSILVHCDIGESNDGLLRVVADLAARFDAAVIGVAAIQPLQAVYDDGMYIAATMIDEDRTRRAKELLDAESAFRTALGRTAGKLDWRATMTQLPLSHFVAGEARLADLIVTKVASNDVLDGTRRVDIGDLIMQAGRPVLIVPETASKLNLDRMMVAWKDTREARRAVADALPLLQKASQVIVASIVDEADKAATERQVGDVVAWLGGHGVSAEAEIILASGDNGDQLDELAKAHRIDITVAGAYGHSRLREWALGGVTRNLLQHGTGCSLLSH